VIRRFSVGLTKNIKFKPAITSNRASKRRIRGLIAELAVIFHSPFLHAVEPQAQLKGRIF
jgi:hypothetical protein